MNLPFEPYSDVPTLQTAIADAFCELADASIESHGSFSVSLSGGSTPKRVYEMLAERPLNWGKIHLFWGDERNVPHDHADSNYRMVKESLLDKVDIPTGNIHAVPVNVDAPAAAALEYEKTIAEHFGSGKPQWDLVLLGMGDDAHTASLFPGTAAISETARLYIENWVPKFDAFRYTTTFPAIQSGRNIWFMIAGEAKQQALQEVLSGDRDRSRFPSQGITPTRWFVDQSACG